MFSAQHASEGPKLRAWVALRGKEPGPLFLQLGKGGRVLAGRCLSGDGVHKILETIGAKLGRFRRRNVWIPGVEISLRAEVVAPRSL